MNRSTLNNQWRKFNLNGGSEREQIMRPSMPDSHVNIYQKTMHKNPCKFVEKYSMMDNDIHGSTSYMDAIVSWVCGEVDGCHFNFCQRCALLYLRSVTSNSHQETDHLPNKKNFPSEIHLCILNHLYMPCPWWGVITKVVLLLNL